MGERVPVARPIGDDVPSRAGGDSGSRPSDLEVEGLGPGRGGLALLSLLRRVEALESAGPLTVTEPGLVLTGKPETDFPLIQQAVVGLVAPDTRSPNPRPVFQYFRRLAEIANVDEE